MRRAAAGFLLVTALAAQDQRPTYPEGVPVPHGLRADELRWLELHPLTGPGPRAVTPPPTGPLHCVAEYEPMAGIVMAWEGGASLNAIQTAMAKELTLYAGARVWISCDDAGEAATVTTTLQNAGCNMGLVTTLVAPTDTIWLRDYGPRYVYQGDCRVIVDHTYNRPRPFDDAFPKAFGALMHHALYEHQLVHGGGNYHLSGVGDAYATRLIANENPALTEAQIVAIWKSYQNCDTTLTNPFPTTVDSTQHIDMWMEIVGDRKVVISSWPLAAASTQAQICDQTASQMQTSGYQVTRVPALSVGGVHYTWCNVVVCNNVVLIPSYTNATAAPYNAQALAAWQSALPAHRITAINCDAIVALAGVMHCIVQHVPAPKGGAVPTAYLIAPNGGEAILPNAVTRIRWVSDDDVGTTGVDVQLSLDGGQSWPTTLAANVPDAGYFDWLVPDLCGGQARVRVVVHDAQSNTGSDASDADFAILGTGCVAANLAYGAGKPGLAGVPALTSATLPKVPSLWTLGLANALPSSPAFALYGLAPASVPFDGGTLLLAYEGYVPLATNGAGAASLTLPVPAIGALYGVSLFWQAWVPFDPGASGAGWAASAGLQMRMGG